ncbi:MAG TPA: hypothetical protein PLE19_03715 [Planctomycetota bacterium]|nr:hypothetical protein [Planctomycetota bacterium]HRR78594.1 hypothetical protein [Planctomycetota bacterium]HRT96513.1 hypothetical protein [Planctomycetota bacterium]
MVVSRRVCGGILAMAAAMWVSGALAAGTNAPRERKPQRYYVFQVMGVSGEVTFEVVSDLDSRERLKEYEEEYKKAGEDWMRAKRDAQKRKEEFKEPAPKGPKLLQKIAQTFKKEEDARAYAEKLQKQWDDAREKKAGNKAGGEAAGGENKPAEEK